MQTFGLLLAGFLGGFYFYDLMEFRKKRKRTQDQQKQSEQSEGRAIQEALEKEKEQLEQAKFDYIERKFNDQLRRMASDWARTFADLLGRTDVLETKMKTANEFIDCNGEDIGVLERQIAEIQVAKIYPRKKKV